MLPFDVSFEIPQPLEDIGTSAAATTAILVLIAMVWTMTGGRAAWDERRYARRFWRQFRRDWDGESARPGFNRVPGVMESLQDIRQSHVSQREVLAAEISRIDGELHAVRRRLDSLENDEFGGDDLK
jgi:hypothetical protein